MIFLAQKYNQLKMAAHNNTRSVVQQAESSAILTSYFPEGLARLINTATLKVNDLPDPSKMVFHITSYPITGELTSEKIEELLKLEPDNEISGNPGDVLMFPHQQNKTKKELAAMYNFDGTILVKPLAEFYKTQHTQFPKSYLRQLLLRQGITGDFILFENRREAVKVIQELLLNLKKQSLKDILNERILHMDSDDKYLEAAWQGYINNLFYYTSSITKSDGRTIKLILPDNIIAFVTLTLKHELIVTSNSIAIPEKIDFSHQQIEYYQMDLPKDFVYVKEVETLDHYLDAVLDILRD